MMGANADNSCADSSHSATDRYGAVPRPSTDVTHRKPKPPSHSLPAIPQ